jgi:hypothetical protein
MFELLADDAWGLKPEAIPVEPKRPLQVVNADGEYAKCLSG